MAGLGYKPETPATLVRSSIQVYIHSSYSSNYYKCILFNYDKQILED